MSVALTVDRISIAFGGLRAVSDFSLRLEPGVLFGLIGPNGAGKTTVFNMLTGVYKPSGGSIRLGERRLDGLRPHQITSAGLARTFQNIRLFPDLTVLDNVRVACHLRSRSSLTGAICRTARHRGRERAITACSRTLLGVVDLADRESELGRNLPYGDQRRLEIARALATEPRVLLLDEPAAGMNPIEKVELRELLRRIMREFDLSVLLIEHDMGVVMDICDRIAVLDYGVTIAEGLPKEIQSDPRVIEAYLGEPASKAECRVAPADNEMS